VLNDRAADNWRPLIAIADLAGGKWADAARNAAVALSGTTEDDSAEIRLLSDLYWLFDGKPEVQNGNIQRAYPPTDRLFSQSIVGELSELNNIETTPWAGWHRGTGFTKRDLAKALKPYGAVPESVRIGATTAKGYYRAKLADAFARYLPPPANVTASQINKTAPKSQKVSVTQPAGVTDQKTQRTAPNQHCDVVTVPAGEGGDNHAEAPASSEARQQRYRTRVRAR
jgi:putative DNA primase/helicase